MAETIAQLALGFHYHADTIDRINYEFGQKLAEKDKQIEDLMAIVLANAQYSVADYESLLAERDRMFLSLNNLEQLVTAPAVTITLPPGVNDPNQAPVPLPTHVP